MLKPLAPGTRHTGVVRSFDEGRGFGFIVPSDSTIDDRDAHVFVHCTNVIPQGYLKPGTEVIFEIGARRDGRTQAIRVRVRA